MSRDISEPIKPVPSKLLPMSSAEGEVSIEQSNLHSQVEKGAILLGVGSVHDDRTDDADTNAGDGGVHQDLLDIEADMMHSNTTSAQNHCSNPTEQYSTCPAQDHAQQSPSSLATRTTLLDNGEVTVTQCNDSPVNKGKGGDLDAENGTVEQDRDKWSTMAEGSPSSNE